MNKVYCAMLRKDGDWQAVRFPDAPAVHTQGKDIEEAVFMATDALSAILALGKKGREYNDPRPFSEVEQEAEKGERVFAILPDKKIMEEYLKESRPKIRVNISLEQDIKNAIDELVKKSLASDRSAFLNDAAREKLAAIG